jgi:hypothetical protein
MLRAAASRDFFEKIVRNSDRNIISRIHAIEIYILHTDFESLLHSVFNETEATILTALFSTLGFKTVKMSDLKCSPIGNLLDWQVDLLPLSICIDKTLFCSTPPTARDASIFQKNNVVTLHSEDDILNYMLRKLRGIRIVDHEVLQDHGSVLPTTFLGPDFYTAQEVIIYDRYFNGASLQTLISLLKASRTRRGSLPAIDLTVFHGELMDPRDHCYIDHSKLRTIIAPYIAPGSSLKIHRIKKGTNSDLFLHDRFMQVDNQYTFVFSAGIGCYFEGKRPNARNRSAQIYKIAVFPVSVSLPFTYYHGAGSRNSAIAT